MKKNNPFGMSLTFMVQTNDHYFLPSVFLLPQMGIADGILDLVSSGTTLRENNLKEIEGGVVLESQVSSC